MAENRRDARKAKLEEECRKCMQRKQERNPHASHMVLTSGCTMCPTGLELQQLDPPQNRGKVAGFGGKRPW